MTEKKRTPLSRDIVIAKALELADRYGIESLSMRRIGAALDVKAMSLYNHVDDKDDLLRALVDEVYGEVTIPSATDGWRQPLRTLSLDTWMALMRHPWACALTFSTLPGPRRVAHMEAMLGTLRRSGFSIESTHHAFHALQNHIVGHAMQAAAFEFDSDDLRELGEQFIASLSAEEFPHLIEHVKYHAVPGADDRSNFALVLDMILDGLGELPMTTE